MQIADATTQGCLYLEQAVIRVEHECSYRYFSISGHDLQLALLASADQPNIVDRTIRDVSKLSQAAHRDGEEVLVQLQVPWRPNMRDDGRNSKENDEARNQREGDE